MSFAPDMTQAERRRLALLGFLIVAAVAAVAAIFAVYLLKGGDESPAAAQTVREYNLEIVGTDIDYGGGNIWHAWTFKDANAATGTVPGPLIEVAVGEKLVVHVTNKLDIVHSFHTHFTNYTLENDGSQLNTITGIGAGAMIPPGGSYTYEFEPTEPGTYYYHCHSADGGHHITEHIHQGLYGGIVVTDPNKPKVRHEALFMGEIGFDTEGDNVPPYIMNGLGLPGGEQALEDVFKASGVEAVQAQFNKTVPVISAKKGEELEMSIVNIGDVVHSFHAHSVQHISAGTLNGQQWEGNVVPLLPGQADTVDLTFTQPGLWLFHCHVVAHADAGMIGLFNITEEPSGTEPSPGSQ